MHPGLLLGRIRIIVYQFCLASILSNTLWLPALQARVSLLAVVAAALARRAIVPASASASSGVAAAATVVPASDCSAANS